MMPAYFTLSLILFLTAVSIGVVVVSSNMKPISKLIIVGILSVSGMMTYRTLNDIYGYPIVMQKDFKDALILGHFPDKENKVLHIWLKANGELNPRSYTVPYKEKTERFLERMRAQHKGKPYRVEIKTTVDGLSPLNQSVEDIEMGELIVLPPKIGL